MAKCKVCGKETLPGKDYCMMCAQDYVKKRQDNPHKGGQNYSKKSYGKPRDKPTIPESCIFKDGFYNDDGFLKREIFIESAEYMTKLLKKESMTQTKIRHLFNFLKAIDLRLKTRKNTPLGYVRENFYRFWRDTEYLVNRNVIPRTFLNFVKLHGEIAVKNIREFQGFVEYLTSIVARMRQKQEDK